MFITQLVHKVSTSTKMICKKNCSSYIPGYCIFVNIDKKCNILITKTPRRVNMMHINLMLNEKQVSFTIGLNKVAI